MSASEPSIVDQRLQPLQHRKRPVLAWMSISFALVCALMISVSGWIVMSSREVRLREAQVTTQNMARALAAQAYMEIKIADVVLEDIVERIHHEGIAEPALVRLRAHLAQLARSSDDINGLFVLDRDGGWLATSLGATLSGNNAERDYFRFHQTHKQYTLHIGAPVLSKSSGHWVIPVSRRIELADGAFAGVALVALRLDSFERAYDGLNLGAAGTAFFALNNGTLLYRRPFDAGMIGMDVSSGDILTAYRNQGPAGTGMMTAKVDGIERLYSYRHLDQYPLIVAAGLSKEDVFAEWDWLAMEIMGGTLAAVAALLWLFGRLLRQIKVREQIEAALQITAGELEKANANLESIAMQDGLTGLANRRAFDDTLEHEVRRAQRDNKLVSLIMLDVDFFKKFNDTYGHLAGDECLRALARAVAGCLGRSEDLAARYGGEEFAVIMPGAETDGALQVAEEIRKAVMALNIRHAGNSSGVVTISLGVATIAPGQEHGADQKSLIKQADERLYQSKSNGRNRVTGPGAA
nr:sensor domain-containing diguanylate cyclase [uncultured Duganella sp.]